jgi:Ca2+-binding EF-hand superfamily protein
LNEILQEMDVNKDGQIDYNDLKVFLSQYSSNEKMYFRQEAKQVRSNKCSYTNCWVNQD